MYKKYENDIEKSVDIYNKLLQIEKYSNYQDSVYQKNIHIYENTNLNLCDDIVLKHMYNNFTSFNEIKIYILDTEFQNLKNNIKKNNIKLSKFKKIAKHILNKFTCKACGFFFEDSVWTIINNKVNHNIPKNKIYFENTIAEQNFENNDTNKFIDTMTKILNNISDNINVEFEYQTEKQIIIFNFVASYKNIQTI